MPKTNAQKETMVVAELAKGTPQLEIAASLNIGQSTVSNIKTRQKELIQKESALIIESTLQPIRERLIKEIKHVNTLDTTSLMDKENQPALARIDKREDMILKAAGIAPSHAPSIHIQNIFNDNRKTVVSPVVADLLGNQLNQVQDADYEETPE
jgi:hypothetical protein